MRFKYKLEGADADWVDAGTRRTALTAATAARAGRAASGAVPATGRVIVSATGASL